MSHLGSITYHLTHTRTHARTHTHTHAHARTHTHTHAHTRTHLSVGVDQQEVLHCVSLHAAEDVLARGGAALPDQEVPTAGQQRLRLLPAQPATTAAPPHPGPQLTLKADTYSARTEKFVLSPRAARKE